MRLSLEKKHAKQDRICFDLSPVLGYPIHLEVYGWQSDRPLHWLSFSNDAVVAEGRFLEAPGLPLFTLEDDEGKRLTDTVPTDISEVARLMPAMDFELAQACAVSDTAHQLALDSPLLLILVVDTARKNTFSAAQFERLLGLKRTDILRKIGLPGSKSLARLTRRITLSPLLPWELEDVISAMSNPDFRALLRHCPKPHLNHLRLLLRQREPLWPGLLCLVDEHSSALDIAWICRMIRDTLNMMGRNTRALERITSRQLLQELHDDQVERFNRNNGKDPAEERATLAAELSQEHGNFPSPPVEVMDGIEPLSSWLELLEEGATMHHCVGSYDIPVATGEVFIYRMVHPERLTISLEFRNKQWVIGEVRSYCNANPSPSALDFVRRWLECHAT